MWVPDQVVIGPGRFRGLDLSSNVGAEVHPRRNGHLERLELRADRHRDPGRRIAEPPVDGPVGGLLEHPLDVLRWADHRGHGVRPVRHSGPSRRGRWDLVREANVVELDLVKPGALGFHSEAEVAAATVGSTHDGGRAGGNALTPAAVGACPFPWRPIKPTIPMRALSAFVMVTVTVAGTQPGSTGFRVGGRSSQLPSVLHHEGHQGHNGRTTVAAF